MIAGPTAYPSYADLSNWAAAAAPLDKACARNQFLDTPARSSVLQRPHTAPRYLGRSVEYKLGSSKDS